MSKFFYLSKRSTKAVSKKRTSKRLPAGKLELKTINVVIGALILIFGVTYLTQINSLATKGYQIRELENQVADLQQENEDLELEALQLQSMGSVKDKVSGLNMVAVGNTDFLVVSPVAVAP